MIAALALIFARLHPINMDEDLGALLEPSAWYGMLVLVGAVVNVGFFLLSAYAAMFATDSKNSVPANTRRRLKSSAILGSVVLVLGCIPLLLIPFGAHRALAELAIYALPSLGTIPISLLLHARTTDREEDSINNT